ncbi:tyrosine-type recombinase/integrase, partial [Corynebacterium sp. UMB6689]|uniref:tyrosine-type recombinase/integrase n=1 Tax=Corynebacterium sp. UMB6689 TaxID=3046341 RepID=UPI0028119B79
MEGLPKTDAAQRDVTLPAECAKRVTEHMHTFVSKDKDALVVHMAGKPGAFLANKSMHAWYDRAVTQLGYPGYRFHDLRHTGLTLYGRAGATLADLMARAGHSDVGAVMIYQHSAVERDRALAARMEKLGE